MRARDNSQLRNVQRAQLRGVGNRGSLVLSRRRALADSRRRALHHDAIFFVRDLSFFFWSRHLWLRHTLFGGEAPWWDPYLAGGQSAIADALNQLLMPVTLAIRLLPSDVVAFNLWVALPLPVAALGTFLFLRRRDCRPAAAALGACAFALSGPIVSMLNTPNLSWSVALMPWVLAAVEAWLGASGRRRFVAIAVVFALQALCGEPVTWAATGCRCRLCDLPPA